MHSGTNLPKAPNLVIVSPGKAGGFSCEPLKAACRDVAATRPLGPPYGWLLHPDGSELACTLAMPTPGQFRPGPSQLDRTASSIPPTARGRVQDRRSARVEKLDATAIHDGHRLHCGRPSWGSLS